MHATLVRGDTTNLWVKDLNFAKMNKMPINYGKLNFEGKIRQ